MEDRDRKLQQIEGRLLAQRRVLARLLAGCRAEDWPAMADFLDERQLVHDGQEDPGAVPSDGMAQVLAQADEFRELAEMASRYRREGGA